jgi:hypothetical protein
MPSFEEMFRQTKGKPIQWNGQTLVMVDAFPVGKRERLRLVFESFGSEWKQGVLLSTKGSFVVNGKDCGRQVVLWQDTAPKQVDFEVSSKDGSVLIKNCWDTGDGVINSWHHGAAMIVDDLGGKRRYRCNDGHPDEDFADIIFTLEVTK